MDSEQKSSPRKAGAAAGWRSGLALGFVALLGTGLLAGVDHLTRARIAQQERRAVLQQLNQIIAPDRYDNAMHDDRYSFVDPAWFPSAQTVTVYRARLQGDPVAVVLKLDATDGYNGAIRLLVGINFDGSIAGVRAVSHKETPGLGDAMETDKSDWIYGFEQRSLSNPDQAAWTVKRDGGAFDQFSGATITPRAIVKAVKLALQYFAANRDKLFEHAADLKLAEQS